MTWIKLNDNTTRHPKVARLSDKSFRIWIDSLCYASEFLTDGVLPVAFLINIKQSLRDELVIAGLWDVNDDASVSIHDYLEHQTSRESVEQERARNRDRRRGARGTTSGRTAGTTGETPAVNPRPEGREQRTDTEIREQRGRTPALIVSPIEFAKKHGRHVTGFCDWCCLPQEQADEFAGKIPGSDDALKASQIRLWATAIRSSWADRIVPDGSSYDFWRNRWTETHGGSKPSTSTLKAVQADKAIDEAFR